MQTLTFSQFFHTAESDIQEIKNMMDITQKAMDETQKIIDYNSQMLHQNQPQNFFQQMYERGKYHAPQNTPQEGILTSDYIAKVGSDAIKKICWSIWCAFVDISSVLCFTGCLIGVMMCTQGIKKGRAISVVSFLIYVIIKLINFGFGG